jgi:urease accessory protein
MQIAHEIISNIDPTSADAMISLDYEGRFLRRKRLQTDDGEDFMVELPKTISLSPSDGIVLDDGRVIGIRPKPEMLAKITHLNLMRMAWHIGNRHTPCQIEDDHLLIQQDHVLEDMLRQLGAKITHITNPFMPEGGAYGHGRTHSHHHQEHDH